jgi:4-carboxymuconolactone decarboxylase
MVATKAYDRGWKKFIEVRGEQQARESVKNLMELSPDYGKFVMEFVWGGIWEMDILDYRTKELITISALTAMGGKQHRVKEHVRDALRNGITKEEILGVMIHLSAYAGFPTASDGIEVLKEVLDEPKSKVRRR